MKLQFLNNINSDGINIGMVSDKIIRLFDFDKTQAELLHRAIQQNLVERGKALELMPLDFIEPVNCYLTLRLSDTDEGIRTKDNINFYCDLTIDGFREMLRLIQPFCRKESRGYQWLYDLDTPIDFLFSAGGSW